MTPAATRFVVLLRGINVGVNNPIAMSDLRDLLEEAGFGGIRTHLRSGNALVTGSGTPQNVADRVRTTIANRLDMQIPVVVRTGAELLDIIEKDPLGEVAPDGSRHFVAFLSEPLDEGAQAALADAVANSDDRVQHRGRELYLWCPDGVRDSRLAELVMAKRFAPGATVRNWNTVTRLAAMLGEDDA